MPSNHNTHVRDHAEPNAAKRVTDRVGVRANVTVRAPHWWKMLSTSASYLSSDICPVQIALRPVVAELECHADINIPDGGRFARRPKDVRRLHAELRQLAIDMKGGATLKSRTADHGVDPLDPTTTRACLLCNSLLMRATVVCSGTWAGLVHGQDMRLSQRLSTLLLG